MQAKKILRAHDLRVTDTRIKLVECFRSAGKALSHADLEARFGGELDRVTIYRSLTSFLDKGILHRIPTDSGASLYALCHETCTSEQHIDNHVHFQCRVCGDLSCLHELEIPETKLPDNFSADRAVLLYEGVCDKCN